MVERGDDISLDNYIEIIEELYEEELESGGMVKHSEVATFLKDWFA